MVQRRVVLVAAIAVASTAHADARFALGAQVTDREYDTFGDDESGFGPTIQIDWTTHAEDGHFAKGIHLAWQTWDEEGDQLAHTRQQMFTAHFFVEYRYAPLSVGAGLGFNMVRSRDYALDGTYSYAQSNTMIGLTVQVACDLARTRYGMIGAVVGAAVMPVIDYEGLLTGGDAGVNWHGISGTVGLSLTP